MARINIPDEHKRGFELLVELDEATISSIEKALKNSIPRYTYQQLASFLAREHESLKRVEVIALVQTLVSLTALRLSQSISVEKLASDLAESSDKLGIIKGSETRSKLSQRLERLLGTGNALEVAAKSSDVLADNVSQFVAVRILTDIRPIFAENVDEPPNAAGILHQLKIVHYADLQHKEFFVSMDDDELTQLKETIDRAERKSRSIRRFWEQTKVPIIGTE